MKRNWAEIQAFLHELGKSEPEIELQVVETDQHGERTGSRKFKIDELRVLGKDNCINYFKGGKASINAQGLFLKLNQISGLRNYLILDIDKAENETPEQIKTRFERTLETIKADGWEGITAVSTGSKGYHILIKFQGLRDLDRSERERLKSHLIRKYGAEIGKERDNASISLDVFFHSGNLRISHWKTGKPVTLIEQTEGVSLAQDIIDEVTPDFITSFLDKLKTEVLTQLAQRKRSTASELIVQTIMKKYTIYTTRHDVKPEMWIYFGGVYVPHARTFIREFTRMILGESFTTNFGNLVVSKIEVQTYIDPDEFFGNPNKIEIPVLNGLLDLRTRELTDFTPEKVFFNKIPVKYDPQAVCPSIKEHFQAVLKHEDDMPVIFEIFGYLLWKDHFVEKAIMLSGDGRNGKGKTVELMKRFIGPKNCANVPLQQLDNDLFAVGEMFNKMANLSADISPTALKSTGYFKNLTGRDMISAPRKFLPRVHFVSHAKQIFCANALPRTYDSTPAFWNRWILLEFPYQFLSQKEINALDPKDREFVRLADSRIIDKLSTELELSGLLNLALDGLDRLHEQGDFTYSSSVSEVKEMWIRKSDSFSAFLMDCCEEDYDSWTIKQDLSRAYSIYCRDHKLVQVGTKSIKYTMATKGFWEERPSINGKQQAVWEGIKLNIPHDSNDKVSKGSKDSNGFPTYSEIGNIGIEPNTPSSLTTLTNLHLKPILEWENPTNIYHKCVVCGTTDSVEFDALSGKPICKSCFDNKS